MSGVKGKSGGAREGTGPVLRRLTLTPPAAIYLRELTRARFKHKDVIQEELNDMLDVIVRTYAQAHDIVEPETAPPE